MRKKQMIFYILAAVLFWAGPALTADDLLEDAPIRAKALIEVKTYDRASETFAVEIVKEPAVGPNIATPEALVKAIPSLDLKRIKSKPDSILGNQYSIDKELKLLSELGVQKRTRKLEKK